MFQINLRKLSATSSTNNELKKLLEVNKLKPGDGVWTLNQTDGHGQSKSVWQAESNNHLAYSVYSYFDCLDSKWIYSINSASSIAVLKTLEAFNVKDLAIKWPNDILSGKKKICGILAENQIKGNKIKSIIGIGINLYENSFIDLPKATSVYIETKKKPSVNFFIENLSQNLKFYMSFCVNSKINVLNKMFHKKLFYWKQNVTIKKNGKIVQAFLEKVNLNGLIELKFENGENRCFQPKEIKIIY